MVIYRFFKTCYLFARTSRYMQYINLYTVHQFIYSTAHEKGKIIHYSHARYNVDITCQIVYIAMDTATTQ